MSAPPTIPTKLTVRVGDKLVYVDRNELRQMLATPNHPNVTVLGNGAKVVHVDSLKCTTLKTKSEDEAERLLVTWAKYESVVSRTSVQFCLANTRTCAQAEIVEWASGHQPSTPMLWVTGAAGMGKTSIALSVARACERKDILAGTFFFDGKSTPKTESKLNTYFVRALAQEMSRRVPDLKELNSVLHAIRNDNDIFSKPVQEQMDKLILKPLRDCKAGTKNISSLVIAIDGLDHLVGAGGDGYTSKDCRELLVALRKACVDSSFPLRVMVSSRPEGVIKDFFSTAGRDISTTVNIEDLKADEDIASFYKDAFENIQDHFPDLPGDWPGNNVIEALVKRASGRFGAANTIMEYISGDRPSRNVLLKRLDCAVGRGTDSMEERSLAHLLEIGGR
ncbi:hypothetical protein DFP72DRAFT_1105548 [Ephemerocybe angulata]|uniref:Nephrocystin 3-like N-terminal domain-containing protein n=1 Tax=Ephemerocybe angulata TaxID=980116 RepID=A0A8H6I7B3_9AGAR|nr:hypothetical protein DFP72DRAFT_1105548 [Tulosesus angulatus]